MKCCAIIVAGGSGKRFGSALPKQFAELHGTPVLMHTIRAFARCPWVNCIRVVLPALHIDTWQALCLRHGFEVDHQVIEGGAERYFSVLNALALLADDTLVAVHDGVRPLVTPTLIARLCRAAAEHHAVVPVVSLAESLRRLEGEASVAVDRSLYVSVQTPQVFKSSLLVSAYRQPYSPAFTDDASVVEAQGHPITTVPGDPLNIKITTRADLLFAQAWLSQHAPEAIPPGRPLETDC